MIKKPRVFITGVAGFIGFHLAHKLLSSKRFYVYGLDNLNSYYDVQLKKKRLALLRRFEGFYFYKMDLVSRKGLENAVQEALPLTAFIHLAAQAGVRYSLEAPMSYVQSNLLGFSHVLEACLETKTPHLLYASSSSVYGGSQSIPFVEEDATNTPLSLYAATKKSNEMMAHSYAAMHKLVSTGMRFFTVYGPFGRPDMALFRFTECMLAGKPIEVYNHGKMARDFTYIDDIVDAIIRLIDHPPKAQKIPHQIFNIGSQNPITLETFIKLIEDATDSQAHKIYLPLPKGDVVRTFANTQALRRATGWMPKTKTITGIRKFVEWYKNYYKVVTTSR